MRFFDDPSLFAGGRCRVRLPALYGYSSRRACLAPVSPRVCQRSCCRTSSLFLFTPHPSIRPPTCHVSRCLSFPALFGLLATSGPSPTRVGSSAERHGFGSHSEQRKVCPRSLTLRQLASRGSKCSGLPCCVLDLGSSLSHRLGLPHAAPPEKFVNL